MLVDIVADKRHMPTRQHQDDVGYDCYANIDVPVVIQPGTCRLIPLGFSIAVPVGYTADVRPRSGLTSRGIVGMYGTIDPGYRGEVKANVFNLSDKPFIVHPHDRIAQMVILPVADTTLQQVDELDETERGDGGFGSTGK